MPLPTEFDKKLHCHTCKGKGCFIWEGQDQPPPECDRCNGTGEVLVYYETIVKELRYRNARDHDRMIHERDGLLDWIKENSTCKTCLGVPGKTWGGSNCKECGLVGTQPWPG